jgi:hypothetical protein
MPDPLGIIENLSSLYSAAGNLRIDISNSHFGPRTNAILEATFYEPEHLENFRDDLEKIKNIREEWALRENHPALKQAYEEYQILLKLLK